MTGSPETDRDQRDEEATQMLERTGDVKRHHLSTRIWHWFNASALLILLMSGLMIFNAHPRLYWGEYGSYDDPAWLEIASDGERGNTRIGPLNYDTTGVFGIAKDGEGVVRQRAFPSWATIPSTYDLASARRWHFFFAWLLALPLLLFMFRALFNGHVKNDLHIRRQEWAPKAIWRDFKNHIRPKPRHVEDATRYNILQKFSYIAVIFILLPVIILTGLTMSPGIDAAWPWLLDIFGGRQSARSIHFIIAFLLVTFFLVHIVMVLLSGPINQIRAIITGWYRLPADTLAEHTEQEEGQ